MTSLTLNFQRIVGDELEVSFLFTVFFVQVDRIRPRRFSADAGRLSVPGAVRPLPRRYPAVDGGRQGRDQAAFAGRDG